MDVGNTYHGLTLLAKCGRGAFGEVFYCEDVTHRKMAVKIIYKSSVNDWKRELAGITRYRQITEASPHLLQIYHVEEDDATFYYTMEPADSLSDTEYKADTLAARILKGPIPDAEIYSILSDIFQGIKTIHAADCAHRDIKPDNILFAGGHPKLADIGLITSLDKTMTSLAGTPGFIPPELRIKDTLDDNDHKLMQQCDLYAFGKVMYCVVTGRPPQDFPQMPKNKIVSMPIKLFMRLSIQLCDGELSKRIHSSSELEEEFSSIERKFLFGETILDKISYACKWIWNNSKAGIFSLSHWAWKHKFMACLILLIAAGFIYHLWPEAPFDIAAVKNDTYMIPSKGFSMKIPAEWIPLTKQLLDKLQNTAYTSVGKPGWYSKEIDSLLKEHIKMGISMILCDLDEKFNDNVIVQSVPLKGELIEELSMEEIEMLIKQVNKEEAKVNVEVYEVQKMKIGDYSCIRTYSGFRPKEFRSLSYMFLRKNSCIVVTLTAKTRTFQKQRERFENIIKTVQLNEK